MTDTTKYSELKLRDLKILAAEKGVQPIGDRRKKEAWLLALFAYDSAEAELYIPTVEEEREHLERCYGSPELLEESIEWLSKVDVFDHTRQDLLDILVSTLLDYDNNPRNVRYISAYSNILYYDSHSIYLAKDYREIFKCDYHPILRKYLDELIRERLEIEEDLIEKRKREEQQQQEYSQRTYKSFFNFFAPTKLLPDHLAVLELELGASVDDIKKAYKRLSKIHHPDMPTGNAEAFVKLKEAYDWAIEVMTAIPF